ncbi:MAG: DegT/DnrJ/EryC1/StrS family aminotransferase, partial [Lachnospiraceae bacterium]|nr:DegT/DnrJ/EryC1/StrS family aminotransferase [Lachnospiraceae bacterium]
YRWMDFGSSYLPSDMNAAYLYAQLEIADRINEKRLSDFDRYMEAFRDLEEKERVELPYIPEYCRINGHMFYLKCRDEEERSRLIKHLAGRDILAVFHYIPLHTAPAGEKFGRFHGEDRYTTKESERLLRLPMYYALTKEDQDRVIAAVREFYG